MTFLGARDIFFTIAFRKGLELTHAYFISFRGNEVHAMPYRIFFYLDLPLIYEDASHSTFKYMPGYSS